MATIKQDIKFFDTNILDGDFSKWEQSNASVTGSQVTIGSQGNIQLVVTDQSLIRSSKYMKLVIEASGDITDKNNYNSGTDINLEEIYKSGDSERLRARCVGITPFSSEVNGNEYKDTTVLSMMNQDLTSLTIRIENNTQSDLTIYKVEMYRSQDIDSAQLYEAQQQTANLYGLVIPVLYADPINPPIGSIWIRGDL